MRSTGDLIWTAPKRFGSPHLRAGVVFQFATSGVSSPTCIRHLNATIGKLAGEKSARAYQRTDGGAKHARSKIIDAIPVLSLGAHRKRALDDDHFFDAVICAYTAYLWATEGWEMPVQDRDVFARDGWIWTPPRPSA